MAVDKWAIIAADRGQHYHRFVSHSRSNNCLNIACRGTLVAVTSIMHTAGRQPMSPALVSFLIARSVMVPTDTANTHTTRYLIVGTVVVKQRCEVVRKSVLDKKV